MPSRMAGLTDIPLRVCNMPNHIKLLLSAVVFVTAMIVHFFQAGTGHGLTHWLVLVVGGVMIVALWMFPEARKPTRRHGDGGANDA